MLTHPNIDPVALSVGPISIHWYGIMYLLAFSSAWWLAARRTNTDYSPLERGQVDDLVFYGAMGAVLGGRFGYVIFYNFDKFLEQPLWLFKVWEGGMAFHGGLLGVIVAMLIYARRLKIAPGRLLDFVAPLAPIGLGLGRLGNFIGQELWGRAADVNTVPWAMIFPSDPEGIPRHPSQLYQLGLEGVLLFVIIFMFSARPRPAWSVGGLFIICYGTFRFIVEFFRQPDSHIGFDAFGWLTRGQILSLPMIVLGVAVMVLAYSRDTVVAQAVSAKISANKPSAGKSSKNKLSSRKRSGKKKGGK